MAPLVNADVFDGTNIVQEMHVVWIVVSAMVFVLFAVLTIFICACGEEKKKEEGGAQEGEQGKEEVPAPTTNNSQKPAEAAMSGKADPMGGSKKPASAIGGPKSPAAAAAESHKKIALTPPGATCPPQYMPEDEDKTLNMPGMLKKT